MSQQLRRGQEAKPRGRQLDCQGQAIQPNADLGDRSGIGLGHMEAWPHGAGPLQEELDRIVAGKRSGFGHVSRSRDGQWLDRICVFGREMEDGAAGNECGQVRTGADELGDGQGGGEQVLEVVQEQEEPLVPQPLHHAL
jgi:hypothetical protein